MEGDLPGFELWTQVQHISLYNNAFEGTIPDSWQAWTNLETLDLAKNKLSDGLGLPGRWMQMKDLTLGGNQLDIDLTQQRTGLMDQLESLDLGGNTVGSTVPVTIGKLNQLLKLNVANSQMTGRIPDDIAQLTKLGKCGACSITHSLIMQTFSPICLSVEL